MRSSNALRSQRFGKHTPFAPVPPHKSRTQRPRRMQGRAAAFGTGEAVAGRVFRAGAALRVLRIVRGKAGSGGLPSWADATGRSDRSAALGGVFALVQFNI